MLLSSSPNLVFNQITKVDTVREVYFVPIVVNIASYNISGLIEIFSQLRSCGCSSYCNCNSDSRIGFFFLLSYFSSIIRYYVYS